MKREQYEMDKFDFVDINFMLEVIYLNVLLILERVHVSMFLMFS